MISFKSKATRQRSAICARNANWWIGLPARESLSELRRAMLELLGFADIVLTSSSPRDESVRRRTRDCSIHLRFPIAINFMCAFLETRFPLIVLFELLSQQLKPFKGFLRATGLPLVLYVGPQLAPNHANISADQVVHNPQRDNALEDGITEPFYHDPNGSRCLQSSWVRSNLGGFRSIAKILHDKERIRESRG